MDGLNEAERVGISGDAPGGDQFEQAFLLTFSIGDGLPRGVGHTHRLKRGAGAGQSWLARDMSLIHRGGEATWVGKTDERLPPGLLMGRCEQHAVNIEDAGGQYASICRKLRRNL